MGIYQKKGLNLFDFALLKEMPYNNVYFLC